MNREEILEMLVGGSTKRDKQSKIGPSELGGCRRRVWHRLQGTTPTNPRTKKLAAIMGTAIHRHIESRFDVIDPFEQRFLRELEVSAHGMTGHVDCYDTRDGQVIDWKTTTKRNLVKFPSVQQQTQVQVYGYLLSANGYPVNDVTLVALSRDGNEDDIKVMTYPYDPAKALEAFEWLKEIEAATQAPPPEEKIFFCRQYCQFYDQTGETGCEAS